MFYDYFPHDYTNLRSLFYSINTIHERFLFADMLFFYKINNSTIACPSIINNYLLLYSPQRFGGILPLFFVRRCKTVKEVKEGS